MISEKISFLNAQGHLIAARIDLPYTRKPKACALFAHCFTCSKDLRPVENISRSLTGSGIAVLRFDFTGLGRSEGDFSDSNFSSNISDLLDAYTFLAKNYEPPQILIGHSLGGAAVLNVAAQLSQVRTVVTIGAPAEPDHVRHLLTESEEEILELGSAQVNIGGRPFRIKKQFLDDLERNKGFEHIKRIGKSLLIIHSPQDEVVEIENAATIYSHAMHPKSFISLDKANHLMTNTKDSHYVGTVIASWAGRYIEPRTVPTAPEGEVWTTIEQDKFLTHIVSGHHQLIADEPEEVGGKDLGPSPYDYLLTSLGTCTAMTLRMYADHKEIDLKKVKIYLTHNKVHRKDSEEDGSKIDQLHREIELEGNLTEEQRKRLIEIADRCPVHRTLENGPEIITSEKKD